MTTAASPPPLAVALPLFAACFAVAAVCAWAIGVETRGQRLPEAV